MQHATGEAKFWLEPRVEVAHNYGLRADELAMAETIVIGGGVFGPAARFLDAIAAESRRWAQPVAMRQVTFEASRLGGDAALDGAAAHAGQARRAGGRG